MMAKEQNQSDQELNKEENDRIDERRIDAIESMGQNQLSKNRSRIEENDRWDRINRSRIEERQ